MVFSPAGIGNGTLVANDGIAIAPAEVTNRWFEGRNNARYTTGDSNLLTCTVNTGCSCTGILIGIGAIVIGHTTSTTLLGYMLAGAVDVAEVRSTRIAIVTVLVLLAASVVNEKLTLGCGCTFPHVARCRTIRVNTTLHF